jgi:putative ABC transport system permease protein
MSATLILWTHTIKKYLKEHSKIMTYMLPFLITTAFTTITRNKSRSLLTILSIIIGIATVIATLAIGRGAQEKIRSRIASMGNNVLSLYAGNTNLPHTSHTKTISKLTLRDVEFFKTLDPAIMYVGGLSRYKDVTLSYYKKTTSAPLTGTQPDVLRITNRTLLVGRNYQASDIYNKASVIILGSKTAEALFGSTDPIGKIVRVENYPFTVIGVLKPIENHSTFYDNNNEVYMPLTTAKRLAGNGLNDYIQNIIFSLTPDADTSSIERLIKRILRARHQLTPGTPDDFTIWNQSSMMVAAEESSSTFNLFLLIVASLSLLVGGLGVSNIMLVTVTERTQEIGIRMALGASPFLILMQFILEATILCSIGGCIGALLGITTPYILASVLKWPILVTPFSVCMSILMTTLIGLFFGFLPARRAARLSIVDALNDH